MDCMGSGKRRDGRGTVEICREIAQPEAERLGLSLWDVRFVKEGATWYLRYIIDKDGGVDINDCVALTRALNPLLDAADPIEQSYCLEVQSPGVERELTRPEHFEACKGMAVAITLIRPLEGKREFAGLLLGLTPDGVSIEEEDGTERTFPQKEMARVHLIDVWEDDGEDGGEIV